MLYSKYLLYIFILILIFIPYVALYFVIPKPAPSFTKAPVSHNATIAPYSPQIQELPVSLGVVYQMSGNVDSRGELRPLVVLHHDFPFVGELGVGTDARSLILTKPFRLTTNTRLELGVSTQQSFVLGVTIGL